MCSSGAFLAGWIRSTVLADGYLPDLVSGCSTCKLRQRRRCFGVWSDGFRAGESSGLSRRFVKACLRFNTHMSLTDVFHGVIAPAAANSCQVKHRPCVCTWKVRRASAFCRTQTQVRMLRRPDRRAATKIVTKMHAARLHTRQVARTMTTFRRTLSTRQRTALWGHPEPMAF